MDMDMYGVSQPGWYLFDDNHRSVGGPFSSRQEAMNALGSQPKKQKLKKKPKKRR